jgi:hypothetical protein
MAVIARGPVFAGGFEAVTVTDGGERYRLWYLPDLNNDELQQRGEAPVYYWMPNQVRLARKGDTGDYKFHLLHFVGVMSEDTNVGVEGREEVAGGVLSLTTTTAPPLDALQQSHEQILDRFRGRDDHYWGWRTRVAPRFQPMPISTSVSAISSLSPATDGSIPGVPAPGGGGNAGGNGGAGSGGGNGGPPPGGDRSLVRPRLTLSPPTLPLRRAPRSSNLDAWHWQIYGEGASSIDPAGENAFSAMVGSLPAALLWQGFRGAYSPITVSNSLALRVWSPTMTLIIRGNWERIFEHFSASAEGRAWWFQADIQTELNNMIIDGTIEVDLQLDETVPGASNQRDEINKRIEQITKLFMDQAKTRIFDPAPPQVTPAEASSGGGLFGIFSPYQAGFALNYRRDRTQLDLSYTQTESMRYDLTHVVKGTLEGFYDEIKADPQAEHKYFTTVYLDDWDRKVTRFVTPVANWREAGSPGYTGDPIEYLSAELGYPNTRGELQWTAHQFTAGDRGTWHPAFAQKKAADVVNGPEDWSPDKTFVRRRIHLTEPPSAVESPYARYQVLKNVIELDPGENGTLTNANDLEVRADSAGKLAAGPIDLNVVLENARQLVEVELQALDDDLSPIAPSERFVWKFEDQETDRFWIVFTGNPDYRPTFRYRVHVIVKGGIFSAGQEWYGPWVESASNGPLTISVPTPDEAVSTRRLSAREILGLVPVGAGAEEDLPVTDGAGGNGMAPIGPPPSGATADGSLAPPPSGRRREPRSVPDEQTVSGYRVSEPRAAQPSSSGKRAGKRGLTARDEHTAERPKEREEELELDPVGWSAGRPDQ